LHQELPELKHYAEIQNQCLSACRAIRDPSPESRFRNPPNPVEACKYVMKNSNKYIMPTVLLKIVIQNSFQTFFFLAPLFLGPTILEYCLALIDMLLMQIDCITHINI
jgi:hypothetical protein